MLDNDNKKEHVDLMTGQKLSVLKDHHEKIFKTAFAGNDKEKLCEKLANYYASNGLTIDNNPFHKGETQMPETDNNDAMDALLKVRRSHLELETSKEEKKQAISEHNEYILGLETEIEKILSQQSPDINHQLNQLRTAWSKLQESKRYKKDLNKEWNLTIDLAKSKFFGTMDNINQFVLNFG